MTLLIATIFCLSFTIESMIGFGGSLMAFAILGFFVDIKDLILIGIYIASCASIFVFASDHKSFDKKVFLKFLPLGLVGTILGIIFFAALSSSTLLKVFGSFLIILSLRMLLFEKVKFPKFLVKIMITFSGLCHGLFGMGGPFFVVILKEHFKNKSSVRTTMAAFFIAFNLVRVTQLSIQGQFHINHFIDFWWIAFPLAISIYLGHKVHVQISEQTFKKAISLLAFFSGVKFLL